MQTKTEADARLEGQSGRTKRTKQEWTG